MDLEGNLIGSVDGMTGHLGCLTMNPADGRVYGSLEYKDDAIGKGIRRTLDAGQVAPEDEKDQTGFYVAIFRRGPHHAPGHGCRKGSCDDHGLYQGRPSTTISQRRRTADGRSSTGSAVRASTA